MDVTSSVESLSHKTIKQKFMRWASKWYYADIVDENPDKPDVTLLICLLQSIGFQLRQFEKSNDNGNIKLSDNNSVKVTIECGISKMKAILELDNVKCQCPNLQDASFWSVSGTAPTGSMDCINKYEESGSNLLPRITKDTHRVIHDIVHCLLNIIKNKMNINQNMDESVSVSTYDKLDKNCYDTYKTMETPEIFARCYTQPEMPSYIQRQIQYNNNNKNNFGGSETLNKHLSIMDIRTTSSCKNIPSIVTTPAPIQNPTSLLIRQKTWDMETQSVDNEPRSSPPQINNSPVITTQLCTSLGRVSLQSDDCSLTLMECLRRARFYIEKAQNIQTCKRSPSTPGSLSGNTYKDSDSLSKSTGRSKTSSRVNLQMRSTLSSAAKKKSPSGGEVLHMTGQKMIARRSVSGIGSRLSISSPRTATVSRTTATITPTAMSTNLPMRRQTVGAPSQSLKLAVAGAKRKVDAAKMASLRTISSGSISSNSSMLSTASHSRVVTSGKRRVSPEINNSTTNTISSGDLNQVKLSGTNAQTPNNSGSLSSGIITPKSTGISRIKSSGINSGLKKPMSNLPKFGISKK